MILACGEALFDLFAETAGDRLSFDARPGGSPFNVAVGLARLDCPVAFFGALSHDLFGERLLALLRREGVDTALVGRRAAPTTLSVVGVDASGSPAYAFYGDSAADRRIAPQDLPELDETVRLIHLGSYSTVVAPVGDALVALARREHGRRLIAYDPNVRLSVVDDPHAWRSRLDDLLPDVDLLKISAEDAGLLFPDRDPAELARDWLKQDPSLVVVTRGGDGADAFTRQAHVHRPARRVTVVDTVGAGDTFQAALLDGLWRQRLDSAEALAGMDAATLAALLDRAIAAAAVTCTRRGADLPRRGDLDRAADHPAPVRRLRSPTR